MTDNSSLILDEIRGLRAEFNSFSLRTEGRLSTVESQTHDLCGNGQPGRVSRLEKSVAKLLQWRWWLAGAAAGAGAVVSCIGWIIERPSK